MMSPIYWIFCAVVLALAAVPLIRYRFTTYYKATGIPYLSMRCNSGRYGEYLICQLLRRYEKKGGVFLFNLYLPKRGGGTAELDMVLVTHSGVFVFESKNYSGWIYGRESDYHWTQLLPWLPRENEERSRRFYNPITQNRNHLRHLAGLVGYDIPLHSIVVFSERCVLKRVRYTKKEVRVIKRSKLQRTVRKLYRKHRDAMDDETIAQIVTLLSPYTHAKWTTKVKHNRRVRRNQKRR